mmetsp:Transcript_30891/g.35479  ORF Transcript_30891/g.35479 Transcript_30891/m.35479 type:complete len:548 (-) Transcript_30891:6-1649(-)
MSSSLFLRRTRRLFIVSLIVATTSSDNLRNHVNRKRGGSLVLFCDAFVLPHRQQIIPRRQNQRKIDKIIKMPTKISTVICLTNIPTNDSDDSTTNGADNKKNSDFTGLLLAIGIVLSLAGMSTTDSSGGVGKSIEVTSSGIAAMTKVGEVIVPSTSTDLIATTLGESIGGVIGAVFSVAINFVIRGGGGISGGKSREDKSSSDNNDSDEEKASLLSQGISDSDYFIANSASYSLLEVLGVPESVAKFSSIFIAAIPSQLVKIGASASKQKRAKENQLLSELLREDQERKLKQSNFFLSLVSSSSFTKKIVDPKKREPVAASLAIPRSTPTVTRTTETTTTAAITAIDFVEVFADITRWLEYDVLKTEYGETALSQIWNVHNTRIDINPIESAVGYALLGALAAVSSRWYADVLYGQFCYGPQEKQKEVRTRTAAEWFSLYSSTAASSFALFGCYEFFQLPIGRYIQGTLAGGVEGCVGSSKFDQCLGTYIDTNSPGPTSEAQLRALVTNLYAVWIRLQDIAVDTSADDVSALVRAWSVSVSSFISNL